MKEKTTKILTEAGIMLALSTVLSMLQFFKLPQGGSVTILAMLPLLLFSYRHELKWGILCCFAASLIQLLIGLQDLKGISLMTVIGAVLLDFIFAYTVLGFASVFKKMKYGFVVASAALIFARFVIHYLSGIILWRAFAEGTLPELYSLIYNGSYMGIELLTHCVAAFIFTKIPVASKFLNN